MSERIKGRIFVGCGIYVGDADDEWVPAQRYDAIAARVALLEQALTPRRWTADMNRVWHLNLPDTNAAFMALRELALAEQPDTPGATQKP